MKSKRKRGMGDRGRSHGTANPDATTGYVAVEMMKGLAL